MNMDPRFPRMLAHNAEDLDFKPTSNWAENVNLDSPHFRQKSKWKLK